MNLLDKFKEAMEYSNFEHRMQEGIKIIKEYLLDDFGDKFACRHEISINEVIKFLDFDTCMDVLSSQFSLIKKDIIDQLTLDMIDPSTWRSASYLRSALIGELQDKFRNEYGHDHVLAEIEIFLNSKDGVNRLYDVVEYMKYALIEESKYGVCPLCNKNTIGLKNMDDCVPF